jgi:hypothetical protein
VAEKVPTKLLALHAPAAALGSEFFPVWCAEIRALRLPGRTSWRALKNFLDVLWRPSIAVDHVGDVETTPMIPG